MAPKNKFELKTPKGTKDCHSLTPSKGRGRIWLSVTTSSTPSPKSSSATEESRSIPPSLSSERSSLENMERTASSSMTLLIKVVRSALCDMT
ncbi:hypothetical protein LB505_011258 [Fusarium chuoi]|nr:hypothetical protein LB505_011258 [Fusarium chuoi]